MFPRPRRQRPGSPSALSMMFYRVAPWAKAQRCPPLRLGGHDEPVPTLRQPGEIKLTMHQECCPRNTSLSFRTERSEERNLEKSRCYCERDFSLALEMTVIGQPPRNGHRQTFSRRGTAQGPQITLRDSVLPHRAVMKPPRSPVISGLPQQGRPGVFSPYLYRV
jgi:hypothetical protein